MIGRVVIIFVTGITLFFSGCIHEECVVDKDNSRIDVNVVLLLPDHLNSFNGLFPSGFRTRIYSSKNHIPLHYDFMGRYASFSLPVDDYQLLLYSSDFYNEDVVIYRNMEKLETAEAYVPSRQIDNKESIEEPDPLFSDYRVISSDNSYKELNFQLQPRVFTYRFRISVEGLQYIREAQFLISGQYASVYLRDGTHKDENPVCVRSDLQLKENFIEGSFRSFGSHQGKEIPHHLFIHLTSIGGDSKIVTIDNLTESIKALPHGGEFVVDQKIVITGGGTSGGFQPGIDDWEDKEVILPV